MKLGAYAAIAALWIGSCGVASATDLMLKNPPPEYEYTPVTLWTGPYVGAHLGGARGKAKVTDTYDYYGDPTAKNGIETSGSIGGVQIGYNIQKGNLVYGIEADFGWLDLDGTESAQLPVASTFPLRGTYSSSGGVHGDITGRVGYARDRGLFYLKGGVAFLNADFKAHYDGENCSTMSTGCGTPNKSKFDFSHSDTLIGWTLGAGVEYALTSAVSIKAEYQHFDFGSMSYDYEGDYRFKPSLTSHLKDGHADISTTADAITVGLNYRIGDYGGPMK